jgi:hypothetical protein
VLDEAKRLIDQAVGLRDRALSDECRAERVRVDARNKAIQAGVKAPASGTYGKAVPPKRV